MRGFQLHPEAFLDVDEIAIYIGQDNPEAAHRVVNDVFEAFQKIVTFPHIGHLRSDLTNRPLRFLCVRDYLVAYAREGEEIWILAELHGHRNPRVLAAILRGRD